MNTRTGLSLSPEEEKTLKNSKIVVIIGLPASGKSYVAELLHENLLPNHSLYHTDDYIDYGYEQSLYALIKDMEYDTNELKIIEGVQGYRFLRKALETGKFKVDTVITVSADPVIRTHRYLARGKGNLPASFEKNLTTIWQDYLTKYTAQPDKTAFITIHT
jgi:predicted AAA+ superfamily ATPase